MNRCIRALATLLVAVSASAAPPLMRPGLWEITLKTEYPVAPPPNSITVCYAKERAEAIAPPKYKEKDDCQSTGALLGNQLKYAVRCGRKNSTSDVEITYSGDRYEGTITLKEGPAELRQKVTARWIGECDSQPGN